MSSRGKHLYIASRFSSCLNHRDNPVSIHGVSARGALSPVRTFHGFVMAGCSELETKNLWHGYIEINAVHSHETSGCKEEPLILLHSNKSSTCELSFELPTFGGEG